MFFLHSSPIVLWSKPVQLLIAAANGRPRKHLTFQAYQAWTRLVRWMSPGRYAPSTFPSASCIAAAWTPWLVHCRSQAAAAADTAAGASSVPRWLSEVEASRLHLRRALHPAIQHTNLIISCTCRTTLVYLTCITSQCDRIIFSFTPTKSM